MFYPSKLIGISIQCSGFILVHFMPGLLFTDAPDGSSFCLPASSKFPCKLLISLISQPSRLANQFPISQLPFPNLQSLGIKCIPIKIVSILKYSLM